MLKRSILLYLGVLIGALLGLGANPLLHKGAEVISEIFINLLKLVSLPLIFLSILSTATGMEDLKKVRSLGSNVIKYTLLTTVAAATTALILFLVIDPINTAAAAAQVNIIPQESGNSGYLTYLLKTIPNNFLAPFIENHVIGVLFLAILLSCAVLTLPKERKDLLHFFFSSLYKAIMAITGWIVQLMPIAVMAMAFLFVVELNSGLEFKNLALYLLCVIAANIIQAFIFLPTLLKIKKISPIRLFRALFPALSLAFFSKSSSAALPLALRCIRNSGVKDEVADFSLPLCTTINMNACAAFILTTVLFVSMSSGVSYSGAELFGWIFIATIAAIGNAGIPMGCFFLSSALLAAMDVPLTALGLILPFYSLIDMLESAINVWSDGCVTAIVSQEQQDIISVTSKETIDEQLRSA